MQHAAGRRPADPLVQRNRAGVGVQYPPRSGADVSGSFLRAKSSILAPYPCRGPLRSQTGGQSPPFCGRHPPCRQRCLWYSADNAQPAFLSSCSIGRWGLRGELFPDIAPYRLLADSAASLGHQRGAKAELFVFFSKAHIFAALPLRQLDQRVAAHQASYRSGRRSRRPFTALGTAPFVNFLWSPVSSTGGTARPSHTSGRVNWGYSSSPSQ